MDWNEYYNILDDDDEEFQWFIPRDPYTIEPGKNGFLKYTDSKFYTRYRMKKETAWYLLSKIESKIRSQANRNHAVEPEVKLLLTLRFYVGGLIMLDARELVGVSKSTACNIIRYIKHEIAKLASELIKMPTGDAIQRNRELFYQRARFPRAIGSLDCTHIRILSPGGHFPEVFRNRKGYFSLNVQSISSADLKFLDIVARFPGSVHDQTIFNSSTVKEELESGIYGNDSIVVADGGYANTKFIATPLRNPITPIENLYNESIIRIRNPVERQYGVWKKRFPILSLGIRMGLKKTQSVIIACAGLHNICIDFEGEQSPPDDSEIPMLQL